MAIDSTARICRSMLHSSSRATTKPCVPSLRTHSRKLSRHHENEGSSRRERPPHSRNPSHPIPATKADAIAHLRETFPPLEFPADVAERMTTHISWNRGVDGHNGRLGFIGRRVLHTYLLLFLHECLLPPQGYTHRKNAPIPPSSRFRHTTLVSGKPIDPLSESYDDISERLLNTYVLGQHVGAAWKLERIMRWTPAIAELDTLRAASPDAVLRSSGFYKVRGATVEGVVGGIFHQFGGAIAHRVFHTRVLPHISHLHLPTALRTCVEEACQRFGGPEGLLIKPSSHRQEQEDERMGEWQGLRESQEDPSEADRLEDSSFKKPRDSEFTKLNAQQRSRERQRLGYSR